MGNAWNDDIFTESAAAAFWQTLSLPPLLLGLFGILGYVGGAFGPDTIAAVQQWIIDLTAGVFSSNAVDEIIVPTVTDILTIARGEETATYPARTMFVLACNPCPCGEYHPTVRDNRCTCTEVRRRDYRKKISGPIADRIDITRHIEPVRAHEMRDPLSRPEPSAAIRARVSAARGRQRERYDATPWRLNADVAGPALRERWPLTEEADLQLTERVYAGELTRRGATRVHRLAWTVADLRDVDRPGTGELDIALRLRTGEPLSLETLVVGAR